MNLKLFPGPKTIHSSEMLRRLADAMARTTIRLYKLCLLTLICCTLVVRLPVGAGGYECRPTQMCMALEADTSWRLAMVVMRCLLVSVSTTLEARKGNSCILLSSTQRISCQ